MNDAQQPQFHLASASPRRREILSGLGLAFSYGGVDLDESPLEDEAVEAMALRLAREKAIAANGVRTRELPVLAADTIVVLDQRVFGKPASEADCVGMLTTLSGRCHRVITAVVLQQGDVLHTALSETSVQFRDISPDEARRYWHSGEPGDKAGSYAIQGLGGAFVESISGSYSGVVGLPVYETVQLLEAAGIPLLPARDQDD